MKNENDNFFLLVLGGSAGSLDAVEQILKNNIFGDNISIVLVQHLGASKEEYIPDILKKWTNLQIEEIKEGENIEKGKFYYLGQGSHATIEDCKFSIKESEPVKGKTTVIDLFLESAAECFQERLIAVILSGMGDDGSKGIISVKEKGGLIIVQEPSTCGFDSMPISAIKTGLIDYVVPAAEIQGKVKKYMSDVDGNTKIISDENVEKICDIIEKTTGNSFHLYKKNTVKRRIARQMIIESIGNIDDYIKKLEIENPFVERLVRCILIGVTEFFRDKEAFEALKNKVIPEIVSACESEGNIRIWVSACSTGEEAYSIAILFKDYINIHKKNMEINIFATDINYNSLEVSKKGIYEKSIEETIPKEYLSKYFTKDGEKYKITKEIRNLITFAEHNIMKDPPYAKMDFISCRNLMIYLSLEMQQKILAVFNFALRSDGYLFLGNAENAVNYSNMFLEIDKKWKIYKAIKNQGSFKNIYPITFDDYRYKNKKFIVDKGMRNDKSITLKDIWQSKIAEVSENNSVIVNEKNEIEYYNGETEKYIGHVQGKISLNVLEMARDGLKLPLSIGINEARDTKETVFLQNLKICYNSEDVFVNIKISPVHSDIYKEYLLILFLDRLNIDENVLLNKDSIDDSQKDKYIRTLENSLMMANKYLHDKTEELDFSNEELKSANEELLSSNEELQSANEEMESSKEEIEAANEELRKLNSEIYAKNVELQNANNDMDILFDSIKIGVIFLDIELNIKKFTKEASDIIFLAPSDIGRPIYHFSSKLFNYESVLEEITKFKKDYIIRESEVSAKSGEYFKMRILPYKSIENKIEGIVITFNDITVEKQIDELKRAEEELRESERKLKIAKEKAEEASRAKSAFLSSMSHELRTPLNGILGLSEVLIDDEQDERKIDTMKMIKQSGENLLNLINDILDISKIEAGMMKVECEKFNINDLIQEIEIVYGAIANSKGNELKVIRNFETSEIAGDMGKVNQILVNLIGNAIKFTHKGTIRLEINEEKISHDRDILTFIISDNGIGINKVKMEKLFEAFEQGDQSLTKKYGGTGLGLAIVKKLTDLLNGEINVMSEIGKGTTFEVKIPFTSICGDEAGTDKNDKIEVETYDFRDKNILIADDNEVNVEVIEAMIQLTGISYTIVADGEEALRKVEKEKFDLILMDLQMPNINGLDATRIIRGREKATDERIPILAVSAYALEDDIERAIAIGVDDYLVKPFYTKQLLGMLKKWLTK